MSSIVSKNDNLFERFLVVLHCLNETIVVLRLVESRLKNNASVLQLIAILHKHELKDEPISIREVFNI